MSILTNGDKAMIRHIVGGLHVSTPDETVQKMWLARGKNCSEAIRKEVGEFAVACHIENRNLYRHVMRGF